MFALEDREHVVGVIGHDPRSLPDHVNAPPAAKPVQGYLNGDMANGNGNGNGHAEAPNLPPPPYAIVLSAGGKVLRFAIAAVAPVSTRKGRSIMRLDQAFPDDVIVGVEPSDGSENVCLATRSARVLIFPVTEANVVAGPAKGVNAVRLDAKDRVLGFALAGKKREGLTVRTTRGGVQVVRATKYPVTSRGGKGYGILQRGNLDAVLHDDAIPIPPVDQVGE